MVEVQVDVVGAEAAEGPFDGAHDVAAGSAGVAVVAGEVTDGRPNLATMVSSSRSRPSWVRAEPHHGFERPSGAVEVGEVEEAGCRPTAGSDDPYWCLFGCGWGAGRPRLLQPMPTLGMTRPELLSLG